MQGRKIGGVNLPDSAVTRTKEAAAFGGASHPSVFGWGSSTIFAAEIQSFRGGGESPHCFCLSSPNLWEGRGVWISTTGSVVSAEGWQSHEGHISAGHCIVLAWNGSKETTYDMRKQLFLPPPTLHSLSLYTLPGLHPALSRSCTCSLTPAGWPRERPEHRAASPVCVPRGAGTARTQLWHVAAGPGGAAGFHAPIPVGPEDNPTVWAHDLHFRQGDKMACE